MYKSILSKKQSPTFELDRYIEKKQHHICQAAKRKCVENHFYERNAHPNRSIICALSEIVTHGSRLRHTVYVCRLMTRGNGELMNMGLHIAKFKMGYAKGWKNHVS